MDRRRSDYRRLAASLLVLARFGLAVVLILYGLGKVIPVQMAFVARPDHQLQLVGDTTLFDTLWGFMGASEAYTMATGWLSWCRDCCCCGTVRSCWVRSGR